MTVCWLCNMLRIWITWPIRKSEVKKPPPTWAALLEAKAPYLLPISELAARIIRPAFRRF